MSLCLPLSSSSFYRVIELAKQDNATAGLDPEETAENTQPKADLSEQRLFISQSLQGYSQSYRKNQVKHSSDAYEEKRSLQWFYGMRDDEDYLDSSKSDELYYQPANYLQGVFMQAQQLAKSQGQPVLINGGGVNMVITDLGTRVYSETKDTLLHKVSFINTEEQSLFIAKAVEQHSFLEQRLSRLTRRASSELLWSLSMWSSKGRLPLNISGESIIQLKRWPNFTRKDLSPHAMEIAALWFNQKVSINETAAISSALGFTFDPENVKTEYAKVSSVRNEYDKVFNTGCMENYEEYLSDARKKMKNAGIDAVIAEVNKQFKQWQKNN